MVTPSPDIPALEAAMKAATPLPWRVSDEERQVFFRITIVAESDDFTSIARASTGDDGAYIVAACNAVPALLAEREEMRKRLDLIDQQNVAPLVVERDQYREALALLDKKHDRLRALLRDVGPVINWAANALRNAEALALLPRIEEETR